MLVNNSSKKLITPSLFNTYYWYAVMDYPNATKEGFLKALRKEETEPTKLMKDGIKFENEIRDICDRKAFSEGETASYQIASIVKDGFWQERVKKEFGDYILYGICDVIKDDTIYDIKLTSKYDDMGKYNYSIQHLIYMYCTGMRKFKYLISSQEPSCANEVFIEEHSWNADSENELKSKIFDCINFIYGNDEFRQAYEENWIAR